jgi:hypothetical protein
LPLTEASSEDDFSVDDEFSSITPAIKNCFESERIIGFAGEYKYVSDGNKRRELKSNLVLRGMGAVNAFG